VRHQEVIFNLAGQTFFYDPPEGQPSGTPTVRVLSSDEDDDGAVDAATTGACSVDSVATTTNGALSIGDQSATLTSGTGVTRLRRYLLTDTDGNREFVEVSAVNGTAVSFRLPLVNSYASGSSFKGCRISIGVDPTWMADEDNISDVFGGAAGSAGYRLRWAYTVDSVATIGVSYADLVRYQSKNLVTAMDVDRVFPGWIDNLGPDDRADQGAGIIDVAFNAVKMDALGDSQLLRRIRNTEILRELVIYRAKVLMVQNQVMSNGVSIQALEVAERLYERRYVTLIREPKVDVDEGGGGAASPAQRLPVWRR
jgi:hypothetical protein